MGSPTIPGALLWTRPPTTSELELAYDDGQGFRCVCPQGDNGRHTCDARNLIYGTASFVTGSFGLACAATAVRTLLAAPPPLTADA